MAWNRKTSKWSLISLFFHIMHSFWQRKVSENVEKKCKNSIYIFYCRAVFFQPFAKKALQAHPHQCEKISKVKERNREWIEFHFHPFVCNLSVVKVRRETIAQVWIMSLHEILTETWLRANRKIQLLPTRWRLWRASDRNAFMIACKHQSSKSSSAPESNRHHKFLITQHGWKLKVSWAHTKNDLFIITQETRTTEALSSTVSMKSRHSSHSWIIFLSVRGSNKRTNWFSQVATSFIHECDERNEKKSIISITVSGAFRWNKKIPFNCL
jgi:hypothetical protein